jgi:hypothetical protein
MPRIIPGRHNSAIKRLGKALKPEDKRRIPEGPLEMAADLGLELDLWQRTVLTSDALNMLLLCGRQVGKTEAVSLLALHTILTKPKALVLCVSPSLAQSQEVYRRTANHWRDLGRPIPANSETSMSVTLTNGSRFVSLPGSEARARGYSADLVIADEAARVEDPLFYAIRPTLAATGGRMILLSTPFGKRGFFYETWISDDESWARVKITTPECPRVSAEFLASERRTLPEQWYRQEYLCEFGDNEASVFRTADVEAAFTPLVTPLFK